MFTVSLCMIVKNEEANLARCLDSAKTIADEIIIVDTGSNDNTKKIASNYTDKIFDFNWIDDFSAARNYSFSKASMDYQMWLDADDIITPENIEKILLLKETLDENIDIIMTKYVTNFDSDDKPLTYTFRERFFKKNKEYLWNDPVHEYINLTGNIYYADDIFIYHKKNVPYTDRNIKIYENFIENNNNLTPRQTYYYARDLYYSKKYDEAIKNFKSFINMPYNSKEYKLFAYYYISLCYKMLNDYNSALQILLECLNLGLERAEIFCEIGQCYAQLSNYEKAIDFYLLALETKKPEKPVFIFNDYYDFIPNLHLSICYFCLKDIDKAIYYNEMAAKYKPDANIVLENRAIFKKIKGIT